MSDKHQADHGEWQQGVQGAEVSSPPPAATPGPGFMAYAVERALKSPGKRAVQSPRPPRGPMDAHLK